MLTTTYNFICYFIMSFFHVLSHNLCQPYCSMIELSLIKYFVFRISLFFMYLYICYTVDVDESEKVLLSIGPGFSSIPDIIKSISITENM
jgi:hypothetical protein